MLDWTLLSKAALTLGRFGLAFQALSPLHYRSAFVTCHKSAIRVSFV